MFIIRTLGLLVRYMLIDGRLFDTHVFMLQIFAT